MNLRSVDLNLLVFFDALMAERHVTKAAAKVSVSQSAMSNALSRLRHVFKDELFIRTSRGMEPTPRALELGLAVHAILQQTSRLMASDVNFDAPTSDASFKLRMSDLVGLLLLPELLARIQHAAPGVSLDVLHISPEKTVEALESDHLDVAVSMELHHPTAIRTEPLLEDKMVCVFRHTHPLAGAELTLEKFLQYGHVKVSMSPTDIRFVDNTLAKAGLQRKVVMNLPHWLLVPKVLWQTDLLAVVSERVARKFAADSIAMRTLPFPVEHFFWTMYWHRRYEQSHGHRWLRQQIRAACAEMRAPSAA